MEVGKLAKYLNQLEETRSRLKITEILAQLLRETREKDVDKVSYLLLGVLAPQYKGVVFNLAERMMINVLAKAYDQQPETIVKQYKELGDIGLVAQQYAHAKRSKMLVSELYDELLLIAKYEGEGSVERKIDRLAKLISQLDPLSVHFIARIPLGKLRLGFSDKTIIEALSWMETGDKSLRSDIEEAYNIRPDIGYVASLVKKYGAKQLSTKVTPQIGTPIVPMLAQRLKSPEDMIQKMGEVSIEPKFDGLRVVIHYQRGKPTKAFSRNMNEISDMFPELQKLDQQLDAKEVILDSEAIGFDPKTKRLFDFQMTMQRRRKHNIDQTSREIPLTFQVFDLLYKDGESTLQDEYFVRRRKLEDTVNPGKPLQIDESTVTSDPEVIRLKHLEYLKKGLEGVIVKKNNSQYVSGRTGWRWVKMKEIEDARGKLVDTVDCVIMGYTSGKGKRTSFGIGQFLVGVRKNDKFLTVSKVGTGLTDTQFRELAKRLRKLTTKQKPKEYEVHKDLEPDYWVFPEVVVELAADEITVSPKHTAGLALRFPRLIGFRDDKSPREATTLAEFNHLAKLALS